jgi:hypothetical protein
MRSCIFYIWRIDQKDSWRWKIFFQSLSVSTLLKNILYTVQNCWFVLNRINPGKVLWSFSESLASTDESTRCQNPEDGRTCYWFGHLFCFSQVDFHDGCHSSGCMWRNKMYQHFKQTTNVCFVGLRWFVFHIINLGKVLRACFSSKLLSDFHGPGK